jgi:hypothetical protein
MMMMIDDTIIIISPHGHGVHGEDSRHILQREHRHGHRLNPPQHRNRDNNDDDDDDDDDDDS